MKSMQADLQGLGAVVALLKHAIKGRKHAIILLQGALGSGKTTLVQHFCQAHHALQATSPTFSLMHAYPAEGFCIYHYDFYLKETQQLLEMGVLEHLESQGVHFIEWGSSALKSMLVRLGFRVWVLSLQTCDQKRIYRLSDG
ncbi:tRNA (adenosine(37)-N6)-threonylcarbamoyltransferase complex ATPase subunit type 1 TsaE [Helicobacter sp. L8]|uniref:tRNA (adenosine(37)-N6)-threonylcarbamoyltransferase complex ATPase subunit type 1 TsaE n=1 Tax=Helicobacter sp. L8 TaxID=2316078 RepID=UPI001F093E4A|nr:tRNA (adenosine(37)-N6)-threonylcarbamoyltransferase complex ATPase subunit type 1 TsaE [Helicobacter sp. L8]